MTKWYLEIKIQGIREVFYMDKSFMMSFYREFYENAQHEAVKESKAYHERKEQRYRIETELVSKMQQIGDDLFQLFEKYSDACADEQEVLLEEMYLLGAQDREKMLRGII